ncbi:MAG: redoxin domain-containing protein [Terracidiphilus sp.]|jgi:thiol-disulfide isomerase/thioredoxin
MSEIRIFAHKPLVATAVLILSFGAGLHAAQATQQEVRSGESAKADTPSAETTRQTEPTDPKARKTFASAKDWEKHGDDGAALDDFRKANKQDGGQCWECLRRAFGLATKLGAYKDAVDIAREWVPLAQTDTEKAAVHFRLAMALQEQGIKDKKIERIQESAGEFKTALQLDPRMARTHYHYGVTLAYLQQDDAARAQFSAFLDEDRKNPNLHERAERFVDHIELARAPMAPPFSATTLDGQRISLDGLAGKVVLIDFWATWCGPCVAALPHMQSIAHKFDGQPLVMLSISLDADEAKWKSFVEKNKMTWLQVRDGGLNGPLSKRFGVTGIPATFTIDADGVLEDQHVGDASIEGKLKKLVARAAEKSKSAPAVETADKAPGGSQ